MLTVIVAVPDDSLHAANIWILKAYLLQTIISSNHSFSKEANALQTSLISQKVGFMGFGCYLHRTFKKFYLLIVCITRFKEKKR